MAPKRIYVQTLITVNTVDVYVTAQYNIKVNIYSCNNLHFATLNDILILTFLKFAVYFV